MNYEILIHNIESDLDPYYKAEVSNKYGILFWAHGKDKDDLVKNIKEQLEIKNIKKEIRINYDLITLYV